MAMLEWVRGRYIYLVVFALLLLLGSTLMLYQNNEIGYEGARVYIESLTAIATLTLLYFAYFNISSKKAEDVARLELAVRPILVWELEPKNSGAQMVYKTIKHPIYDFRATLSAAGKELALDERHIEVFETNPNAEKKRDVTAFIREVMGAKDMRKLNITFAYHSEAGGHYELAFTKEISRKGKGFLIEHRKFVSAKYPWRSEAVQFGDEG